MIAIVVLMGLACLYLAVGRSPHLIVWLMIAGGWSQASLAIFTHSPAWQIIDDIPAIMLVVYALWHALGNNDARHLKAVAVFAVTGALSGLALARSADMAVGVAQARQVLLPVGLVVAGYVLRDVLPWDRILTWVLVFAIPTAIWIFAEEFLQRPLIDATWYFLNVTGADPIKLRHGLPGPYYADGIGGGITFRPGGPFVNPPISGFLLGVGAYAAVKQLRGGWRTLALGMIGAALVMMYARAGIVLFFAVVVMAWAWHRLGKLAALAAGGVVAAYLALAFLQQGNTGSHTTGLFTGLEQGVRAPLGVGFGSTGYQAALDGEMGVGSESLLGLYAAWMGWPVLLAAALVIRQLLKTLARTPRAQALDAWLVAGFLMTVATSESSSALGSTPVLWMTVGLVLARVSQLRDGLSDQVTAPAMIRPTTSTVP